MPAAAPAGGGSNRRRPRPPDQEAPNQAGKKDAGDGGLRSEVGDARTRQSHPGISATAETTVRMHALIWTASMVLTSRSMRAVATDREITALGMTARATRRRMVVPSAAYCWPTTPRTKGAAMTVTVMEGRRTAPVINVPCRVAQRARRPSLAPSTTSATAMLARTYSNEDPTTHAE